MAADADLGLVGLAVMGQNLVLNMARNGTRVAVYNRTTETMQAFIDGPAADASVVGEADLAAFVARLVRPRRIMLMVKAGRPVDAVIDQLVPLLDPGDILIDGGNSYYADTDRRTVALAAHGLHVLGVGVSGGEEGALHGPSIMPGGDADAYAHVAPIFTAIAARAHDGAPCVAHMGPGSAGHYVKMVHNGIEYGDMQLIAEAYDLLRRGLGLDALALHRVFTRWNEGPLQSFLIEITADIFRTFDPEREGYLVDVILDAAEQKGTGRWTSQDALTLGTPVPTLTSAVEARALSAMKPLRVQASDVLAGPPSARYDGGDAQSFIDAVESALYAAKIGSYAQGFALLQAASHEYGYGLGYGTVARIWRAGCIIRARFLDDIARAYADQPDLPNLLLAPFFRDVLAERQGAWRTVVGAAVRLGIPTPAMSASLAYYDSIRSARLPANLIQAQRDYFGAHTYARTDGAPDVKVHTDWPTAPKARA